VRSFSLPHPPPRSDTFKFPNNEKVLQQYVKMRSHQVVR
jgi:hypothetical protein